MRLSDATKKRLVTKLGRAGSSVHRVGESTEISGIHVWEVVLSDGKGSLNPVYVVKEFDDGFEFHDDFDEAMKMVGVHVEGALDDARRKYAAASRRLREKRAEFAARESRPDFLVRLFAMTLVAAIAGLIGWMMVKEGKPIAYDEFGGWLLGLCLVCGLSLLFEKHLANALKALYGRFGVEEE